MSTTSSSNKIDEELVCIDAFVHRLREIDSDGEVIIHREPDDPPDFWVTISGTEYAVEVTSIVSDECYAALCRKLLEDVQEGAAAENLVVGSNALAIERQPEIPRRGTAQWKRLVSDSLKSLRALLNAAPSTEACLLQDTGGRITLVKGSSTDGSIGLVRLPMLKWEGEAQGDLADLFQKAIDTKRAKLEKKGILARCPNIMLIFYDAYGYGAIEDAQRAFASVGGYDWLHSVFWAASFSDRPNSLYPDEPGRSGVFLYSRKRAWR